MSNATGQSGEDGIPQEVKAFIEEYIGSIEQLEILLLVHNHRERWFSPTDVSRELYIAEESAARRLQDFYARNLVVRAPDRSLYQAVPASAPSSHIVGLLATAYQERRVRVVNLIFSKPVDRVKSFADAFKFRRKNE